jgi:hypothetical protein
LAKPHPLQALKLAQGTVKRSFEAVDEHEPELRVISEQSDAPRRRDHIRRLKMAESSRLSDVVEYVIDRIILWPALMLVEVGLELLFSFVGVH